MLKIGELSKKSGLSKRTIDYYTQLGLLHVEEISKNGYRHYGEDNLEKIKLIEFYKAKHLTLEEIKNKLDLMCELRESEIHKKLENIWFKLEEVEAELSELKKITGNQEQIKSILEQLRSNSKSRSAIYSLLEIL